MEDQRTSSKEEQPPLSHQVDMVPQELHNEKQRLEDDMKVKQHFLKVRKRPSVSDYQDPNSRYLRERQLSLLHRNQQDDKGSIEAENELRQRAHEINKRPLKLASDSSDLNEKSRLQVYRRNAQFQIQDRLRLHYRDLHGITNDYHESNREFFNPMPSQYNDTEFERLRENERIVSLREQSIRKFENPSRESNKQSFDPMTSHSNDMDLNNESQFKINQRTSSTLSQSSANLDRMQKIRRDINKYHPAIPIGHLDTKDMNQPSLDTNGHALNKSQLQIQRDELEQERIDMKWLQTAWVKAAEALSAGKVWKGMDDEQKAAYDRAIRFRARSLTPHPGSFWNQINKFAARIFFVIKELQAVTISTESADLGTVLRKAESMTILPLDECIRIDGEYQKCQGPCNGWKPMKQFSKAQRSRINHWCMECVQWKENQYKEFDHASAGNDTSRKNSEDIAPNSAMQSNISDQKDKPSFKAPEKTSGGYQKIVCGGPCGGCKWIEQFNKSQRERRNAWCKECVEWKEHISNSGHNTPRKIFENTASVSAIQPNVSDQEKKLENVLSWVDDTAKVAQEPRMLWGPKVEPDVMHELLNKHTGVIEKQIVANSEDALMPTKNRTTLELSDTDSKQSDLKLDLSLKTKNRVEPPALAIGNKNYHSDTSAVQGLDLDTDKNSKVNVQATNVDLADGNILRKDSKMTGLNNGNEYTSITSIPMRARGPWDVAVKNPLPCWNQAESPDCMTVNGEIYRRFTIVGACNGVTCSLYSADKLQKLIEKSIQQESVLIPVIQSPGAPKYFLNGQLCYRVISIPERKRISLVPVETDSTLTHENKPVLDPFNVSPSLVNPITKKHQPPTLSSFWNQPMTEPLQYTSDSRVSAASLSPEAQRMMGEARQKALASRGLTAADVNVEEEKKIDTSSTDKASGSTYMDSVDAYCARILDRGKRGNAQDMTAFKAKAEERRNRGLLQQQEKKLSAFSDAVASQEDKQEALTPMSTASIRWEQVKEDLQQKRKLLQEEKNKHYSTNDYATYRNMTQGKLTTLLDRLEAGQKARALLKEHENKAASIGDIPAQRAGQLEMNPVLAPFEAGQKAQTLLKGDVNKVEASIGNSPGEEAESYGTDRLRHLLAEAITAKLVLTQSLEQEQESNSNATNDFTCPETGLAELDAFIRRKIEAYAVHSQDTPGDFQPAPRETMCQDPQSRNVSIRSRIRSLQDHAHWTAKHKSNIDRAEQMSTDTRLKALRAHRSAFLKRALAQGEAVSVQAYLKLNAPENAEESASSLKAPVATSREAGSLVDRESAELAHTNQVADAENSITVNELANNEVAKTEVDNTEISNAQVFDAEKSTDQGSSTETLMDQRENDTEMQQFTEPQSLTPEVNPIPDIGAPQEMEIDVGDTMSEDSWTMAEDDANDDVEDWEML